MDQGTARTMRQDNEMDGYDKIDQYNPHTVERRV